MMIRPLSIKTTNPEMGPKEDHWLTEGIIATSNPLAAGHQNKILLRGVVESWRHVNRPGAGILRRGEENVACGTNLSDDDKQPP